MCVCQINLMRLIVFKIVFKMTNRTKIVVVSPCEVWCAPGYCSRTLQFFAYVNDLYSTVFSQIRVFVDDCLLYHQIKCRADQETYLRYRTGQIDGGCVSTLNMPRMCTNEKNLYFQYTLKAETLGKVSSTSYLCIRCLRETLEWEALH